MIRLRPSGADEVLIKRVRDWYEPGPGVFIAPQALFSPALLFTTGVNGTWYDPSDLTTLFQDAAGTTPVTAVEQPVGLMLDKSKGLVLGANVCITSYPTTASVSGTFVARMGSVVAGTWYKLTYTVTASTLGNGGVLYLEPSGGPFAYQAVPATVGTYTVYAYAADAELSQAGILVGGGAGITGSVTLSGCTIQAISGNHTFNPSGNSANFPVLSARYNLLLATGTLSTQTVTTQATNYTLRFSGVGTVILSGTATGAYTAGVYTFNASAGSLIVTVAGAVSDADLRVTNDALNQPAYQRVNTATDYDTVGFKPYLKFNGVNQWLQTNSIDFTYGDKMFVCAGVRKLSDAATGVLIELSPLVLNAGAFLVQAPSAPGVGNYAVWTNGATYSGQAYKTTPAIFSAPTSSVISSKLDNAASYQNQIVTRVNGSLADNTQTNTASSGNYGNYPLYIGARAGTSLWFNGRLHGLIVAGKQASASEISSTESYINTKTGAY